MSNFIKVPQRKDREVVETRGILSFKKIKNRLINQKRLMQAPNDAIDTNQPLPPAAAPMIIANDTKDTNHILSATASDIAATVVAFLQDSQLAPPQPSPVHAIDENTNFATETSSSGFPMPDYPKRTTSRDGWIRNKETDIQYCVQRIVSHKDWPKNLDDDSNNEILQELSKRHKDDNVLRYAIEECRWIIEEWKDRVGIPVALCKSGLVLATDDVNPVLRASIMNDLKALTEEKSTVAGHPRYGKKIMHLVHPSLYAYEKGVTHVLAHADAQATTSPPWNQFLGVEGTANKDLPPQGPAKQASQVASSRSTWVGEEIEIKPYKVLWLPSEFVVHRATESTPPTCCINSYINNIHPIKHRGLYEKIGQLFVRALPMMEEVLSEVNDKGNVRKQLPRFRAQERPYDQSAGYMDYDEFNMYANKYKEEMKQYNKTTSVEVPSFSPPKFSAKKRDVDLHNRPLQVIVKVISLNLEPQEKLDYTKMADEQYIELNRIGTKDRFNGGHWHVEGTVEEHIVASACCYLESENVAEDGLSFRDGSVGSSGCELGTVDTFPGRILAWPNYLHHKTRGIVLSDKSKPGHRTLCCFHLVDPTLRIRSTATVPPQQKSWVWDAACDMALKPVSGDTGIEIHDFMVDDGSLIDHKQALERRERLSMERSGGARVIADNFWIPED